MASSRSATGIVPVSECGEGSSAPWQKAWALMIRLSLPSLWRAVPRRRDGKCSRGSIAAAEEDSRKNLANENSNGRVAKADGMTLGDSRYPSKHLVIYNFNNHGCIQNLRYLRSATFRPPRTTKSLGKQKTMLVFFVASRI